LLCLSNMVSHFPPRLTSQVAGITGVNQRTGQNIASLHGCLSSREGT
jgi:hypothetical protein